MTPANTTDVVDVTSLDAATLRSAASTEVAVPSTDEWGDMAAEFDDGSEAFVEHFGLAMPRLKTDFGRNGKGWVDDLTGGSMTELRIVILAQPPSRTFWHKTIDEGGGGSIPDCKSTNLLADAPDDNVPDPQAPKCSACQWSQWAEDLDGKRIKPKCSEAVNVLAYDVPGEKFMWIPFRGTSISPYRKYVSALMSRRIPIFGVETHVTLTAEKSGSLEWLVAKFDIGGPLEPAIVRPLREMAKRAMQTWESAADDLAATAGEVTPADVPLNEEPF